MLQSRPHRSWGDTNSVRVLRVRDLPRKQIRTETSAHFRLCRTAPQRREPAGVIHVSSLWGRVRLWGFCGTTTWGLAGGFVSGLAGCRRGTRGSSARAAAASSEALPASALDSSSVSLLEPPASADPSASELCSEPAVFDCSPSDSDPDDSPELVAGG